jgi:antitoxin YefM
MYQHITLKDLRPKLPQVIDQIDSTLARFIVSKRGVPVAIILAIDDFESLIETLNEETDREAMRRICKGMKEAKHGKTVKWSTVKSKYRL